MKTILVIILCLASSGCVLTRYSDKDGRSLTRISLFGNQNFGKVDLTKGTITGYQSEQSEAAAAVAEGIAAGVAKALAKP